MRIVTSGIGILLSSLVLCAMDGWAAPPGTTPELLKRGKVLFEKHCAVCHGTAGKGDGLAADFLFPKPRDLTSGVFKIRSTPSGEFPTDQDILRTLTNGMPGSAMPSFAFLSEMERKALVAFVKEMGEIDEAPERVIKVPREPAATAKDLTYGKRVYKKMRCADCHGPKGRADGPSAKNLVDTWGYPSPPNDFTRGIYKGGGTPSDVYLRFTTGMDGSPMPSYEESLTEAERWALIRYIKSLAGSKVVVQPSADTIVVRKVSGSLPKGPQDAEWNEGSGTVVPLMRLWQGKEAVDEVSVKAVHNGKEIAFLLEWTDDEVNSSLLRHEDFADSAAIMFSLAPKDPLSEQPHFTMGEKGGQVNIWHWRFDRQLDLAGFRDIETVYPAMVSDDYLWEKNMYPKGLDKPRHPPITSAAAHDAVYLTGWGAGNPVSTPERRSAVEDLNAEGFGTLTSQRPKDQNVKGVGLHVNGNWKVVISRTLRSRRGADVVFKRGGKFPVAFAVWDGAKGDRDGQKAVTTWYVLDLE